MKKILVAFFAIAALSSLFFSCKEKSAGGSKNAKKQNVSLSRIIYSGWDLYEEREDGKMYAVKEAELGDEVQIYLNSDGSVEQKNAIRHLQSGKEEPLDFVRVVYDEKDYWTRDIFLAGPNIAFVGVLLENALAYSAPNGGSVTGTQLKEGSFVAMESDLPEEGEEFVKVVIYNGKPFGKEIYIRKDSIAFDDETKELVRLFSRFNEKTPVEVRDEILLTLINETASWNVGVRDYLCQKTSNLAEKNLLSEEVVEALKSISEPYSVSE